MNFVNEPYYEYENIKKPDFINPHTSTDPSEEKIDKSRQNTNAIFYLNDTQVEHVQIQNMDQFLTVNCSSYFPRDLGFYLHPGEQSCSIDSASLFYPAGYQICTDDKVSCHGKFLSANDMHLQYQFNDQVKEGLQYLNILHNKNEDDAPEFIDINKLVIPIEYDCLNLSSKCETNTEEPLFLKKMHANKKQDSLRQETVVIDDDDDDVIFVKEYKANNGASSKSETKETKDLKDETVSSTSDGIEETTKRRRPKKIIEPRRNPKRQVQLQKASYDLAIKLSLSDYPKRTIRENYTPNNCRRSCRTTGAVFSPPRPLNSYDYKEWPTEGMHERPKYNCKTQKLEKFDYDYNPSIKPKKVVHRTRRAAPVRRKIAPRKRRLTNKTEAEISPQFAQLTHETLLLVIDYVKAVKGSNEIMLNNQKESGDKNLTSDDVSKSISDAQELLTDSSILYCLANNVSQSDLAYFLDSLIKNKTRVK